MLLLLLQLFPLFLSMAGPVAGYIDVDDAQIARQVLVDLKGRGQFTSIQDAVNSVPENNDRWFQIIVMAGVYREKVVIPKNKPFIYMKGDDNARSNAMIIDGSDHLPYGADRRNSTAVAIDGTTFQSATFSVFADNFVARRMTFRNMYNFEGTPDPNIQAVAAVVAGDMVAFYFCNFIGRQDTLCDLTGRHMYTKCGIQGTLDFIFGYATSVFDTCYINLNGDGGYITANGRSNANDTTGFVFKYCEFTQLSSGSAYLGRAWGPYARSVLFHTQMENVIVPAGWDIGSFAGHENDMTFAEMGCYGPGSNEYGNVSRVAWEKSMSDDQEKYYATDFNDAKKWRPQQP